LVESDVNKLIDIAACSAIRDIAVRSEVLKEQVRQDPERLKFLKGVLWAVKYIREGELAERHKIPAKKRKKLDELLKAPDNDQWLENLENADHDTQEALLASMGASMAAFERSEGVTDSLYFALGEWADTDDLWGGHYTDDEDMYSLFM
jgi:hypothetical protein